MRWTWRHWARRWGWLPDLSDSLWADLLADLPLLHGLSDDHRERLRALTLGFLDEKTFTGTHGLEISDAMALSIAAQACLPLLDWGPDALDWYSDFVGIVVHPDEVWTWRETVDAAGVVHRHKQVLAGEAMHGGPVMLAWSQVQGGRHHAIHGYNLVIHEFAHKLDMRHKSAHQPADGCPALPTGFMGLGHTEAAHHWRQTMESAFQAFQQRWAMAQRFGAPAPALDAYGTQSLAEFFAVACEAYFAQPALLAAEAPAVLTLLDAFFHPAPH